MFLVDDAKEIEDTIPAIRGDIRPPLPNMLRVVAGADGIDNI